MSRPAHARSESPPAEEATIRRLSLEPGASEARRRFPRYAVALEMSLTGDHNFYLGFTENVSEGGLFVATHKLQPVGSYVEFEIKLPGSEQAVCGRGEVRWVREYSEHSDAAPGLGIHFVGLEPEAERRVAAFLSQREPIFFDE